MRKNRKIIPDATICDIQHVVDIARNVLEAEDRHPVVVLVVENVLKGGVRHGKQSA